MKWRTRNVPFVKFCHQINNLQENQRDQLFKTKTSVRHFNTLYKTLYQGLKQIVMQGETYLATGFKVLAVDYQSFESLVLKHIPTIKTS